MRLLGSSGTLLQKATRQTHDLLQDIGCQTFYFHDNYEELINNLDSSIHQIESGRKAHKETVAAIKNQEISIARLRMISASADKMLAEMNITQLELPPRLANVKGQINPNELKDYLQENIYYKFSTEAARIDADAIEKILFLRKGVLAKHFTESKYIFVTHNHKFTKHSTLYCRQHCGYRETTAPPIITVNTITRLAWLASGKPEMIVDVSTDLALSCYQASVLDESWYEKFYEMIEAKNPELLEGQDPQETLYLMDIKRVTEDATLGCAAVIDKVNWADVLDKANKIAQERDEAHRSDIDNLNSKLESFKEQSVSDLQRVREELETKAEEDKSESIRRIRALHSQGLKESLDSERLKTIAKLEREARKKAKQSERQLGWLIACILTVVFLTSLLEGRLGLDLSPMLSNLLFYISAILGAIQVVGLMIPKASLLFLGPIIQETIYKKKLSEYMSALNN